LIEDAGKAAEVATHVVQGSWSSSVGASAGTHSGGGAFDLRSRDYTRGQALRLVDELRRRNVCAWWRTAEFGWAGDPHIHGIVRDEPGLSPAAAQQVRDYDRGRNGLASHAPDPFPRPPQSPFQPGGPAMPLDQNDLDRIAAVVTTHVLDIVRKEGISGAAQHAIEARDAARAIGSGGGSGPSPAAVADELARRLSG
jgi:hypothetical protein